MLERKSTKIYHSSRFSGQSLHTVIMSISLTAAPIYTMESRSHSKGFLGASSLSNTGQGIFLKTNISWSNQKSSSLVIRHFTESWTAESLQKSSTHASVLTFNSLHYIRGRPHPGDDSWISFFCYRQCYYLYCNHFRSLRCPRVKSTLGFLASLI